MIAFYLHDRRREYVDRARALVAVLGGTVLSPHPQPVDWTLPWVRIPDVTPEDWAAWLVDRGCSTAIVDGPSEYAAAVADLGASRGVRLAVVAEPGGGVDGELGSAYAVADSLLVPWAPHGSDLAWPARWRERTIHLGALGWQARRAATRPSGRPSGGRWHCVVLSPTGSGPGPRERWATTVETPAWRWTHAGERDVLEDGPIWGALNGAEVAVCAPTSATLAALAATRTPGLLVLPERPSRAQQFLAETAALTAPVLVVQSWPRPEEWRFLLDRVRGLDSRLWDQWAPEAGLARLAEFCEGDAGVRASAGPGDAAARDELSPA